MCTVTGICFVRAGRWTKPETALRAQQLIEPCAHPAEAQIFLLQPQAFADAVVAQGIVKVEFAGCQPVEIGTLRRVVRGQQAPCGMVGRCAECRERGNPSAMFPLVTSQLCQSTAKESRLIRAGMKFGNNATSTTHSSYGVCDPVRTKMTVLPSSWSIRRKSPPT